MKSNKRKHLTESEFKQIKKLQDAGLSVSLTAKIVGRSGGAVASIFKADSLKQHRELQAKSRRKYLKPGQVVPFDGKPPVVAQRPDEDDDRLMQKMTNIETCLNELLVIFKDKEAKANVAFWRR